MNTTNPLNIQHAPLFTQCNRVPGPAETVLPDVEAQSAVDWSWEGLVFDQIDVTIDDFYLKNRAYRPPAPCTHCKTLGLQCFIIQTTSANPNPISSCSSCVALFRQCNLSGGQKRPASKFETPQPVIGQLHGVTEEDDDENNNNNNYQHLHHQGMLEMASGNPYASVTPAAAAITMASTTATASSTPSIPFKNKRSWSRSVKKTRILRNWFACHLDNPYPTEEEKLSLAEQSHMTKTQVSCWLANARRRHRQSTRDLSTELFLNGSPMVHSSFANMTPLERWQYSPPEDEAVPVSSIEKNLSTRLSRNEHLAYVDSVGMTDLCESSSGVDSDIFPGLALQYPSSNSASSGYSLNSTNHHDILTPSFLNLEGGTQQPTSLQPQPPIIKPAKGSTTFQCTFCWRGFKKKYDWLRHERSIHMPSLDSWVCAVPLPSNQPLAVWRFQQSSPECILCGHPLPTDEHLHSHEFEACTERPELERTFSRKDHLWQHLYKFHRCRKWEGWNPDLKLLQHSQDDINSRCGFCGAIFDSWDKRARHLTSHFQSGMTMDEWIGDYNSGGLIASSC